MGMSGGQVGAARRRGRRRGGSTSPMSEINVTPFVDVVLVLLIVFMIAAPLLTSGVPIDLPRSQANSLNVETQPITISIDQTGRIYLQEDEIAPTELLNRLATLASAGAGFEERILLRGDSGSNYGAIMRVMGQINAAGYSRIGLVTVDETSG